MDKIYGLIQRAQRGEKTARDQLVHENTGLVWCVAKRFYGRGVEAEDLFQIGCIGLIKAIDHFDTSYKVKFSTYAVPLISGEIKRYLRDEGMLKVSRTLKELGTKAFQQRELLQRELSRDPTMEELAEALNTEKEMLVMALESSGTVESIYTPIYEKEGHPVLLIDKLEDEKKGTVGEERLLNHLQLTSIMEKLKPEERKLIYLRYFTDATQQQIGEKLGISQVQVSRLEKRILHRMREQWE